MSLLLALTAGTDYALTGLSGTYTLTGGNASLVLGRSITGLAGTYSITGGGANLVLTRAQQSFSGGSETGKGSYWAQLLRSPEPPPKEVIEAIEHIAEIEQPIQQAQKEVKRVLVDMGVVYKEAYQEIYLQLLTEMQQQREEEAIAQVIAMLI